MKKLKTLESHNSEVAKNCLIDPDKPRLNGIACPNCGEELYDTCPSVILTSIPAQKSVSCNCGYVGFRFA